MGLMVSPLRGLSPPTRGSHPVPGRDVEGDRSIPAHAGEPPQRTRRTTHRTVYPRPRGGAVAAPCSAMIASGLSPPTRGSHQCGDCKGEFTGSIPAHAGEPERRPASPTSSWVYPRPRGGAKELPIAGGKRSGLSPPTRGSRSVVVGYVVEYRSIPAHAGEPFRSVG